MMKKAFALMLMVMMVFSVFAMAEEISIEKPDTNGVDEQINTNGIPTYEGIRTMWDDAEAAYESGDLDLAIDKYLECSASCALMKTALEGPLFALFNAKNPDLYFPGGIKDYLGQNTLGYLTNGISDARDMDVLDNSSYYQLEKAYTNIIGLCYLKAGKCYYEKDDSANALTCMLNGFIYCSVDAQIKNVLHVDIDNMTVFEDVMPIYNEILGLSFK